MRIAKKVMGAAAALVLGVALAEGPGPYDFGKHEFEDKCASCHGATGRGDGVHQPYLDRSPADLTTLAKEHGGEFPYDEFYAAVEGRDDSEGDMPCFTTVYRKSAQGDYLDVPYEQDRYLDTRLMALADYVARLQVR